MDGSRVREFLSGDISALLGTYRQFERLLPHAGHAGAAHTGEDGRYVEALVRMYLRKFLPQSLRVSTGFIMRPAVKTGLNGRERRGDSDLSSGQLDVIVHDVCNCPVFQSLGDDVIIPPEGVVAIISVKKHLRAGKTKQECTSLRRASAMCRCLDNSDAKIRGPFLGIISMGYEPRGKILELPEKIWAEIREAYLDEPKPCFDDTVGLVTVFNAGSVFKARPAGDPVSKARYVWHDHGKAGIHLGLQLVLTGILSVCYDATRNTHRRPGFTGFESGRPHERNLGTIDVSGLR